LSESLEGKWSADSDCHLGKEEEERTVSLGMDPSFLRMSSLDLDLDLDLGERSKSHREAQVVELELELELEVGETMTRLDQKDDDQPLFALAPRSAESDKLDSHIELCQSRHGR
jgi:hypothetical protein